MTHTDAKVPRRHPQTGLGLRWGLAFVAGLAFAAAYYGLLLAAAVWVVRQLFGFF